MKKVKSFKGYIIAELSEKERKEKNTNFQVFTKDEWSYGEGCRYPEFDDCDSIEEAIQYIG